MKIKKAIIPAAGYGTRFLPITKTIQKEMLPVLQRPILDYIVDDCISVGVEEIIVVVKEQDQQIRHYYSEDLHLKAYLERMNKIDKYELIKDLHQKVKFTFVTQKDSDPYGSAVPLMLAKEHVINEEAFLYLMGDDFYYFADGSSETAGMIEVFEKSGAAALMVAMEVPREVISKYGIVEYREENGFKYLTNQVEKPLPHEINSNLASMAKFIYTPKIFKYLESMQPDPRSGELYNTIAYGNMAKEEKVVIHTPRGEYVDCGYMWGWLHANLTVAKSNPELWQQVKDFVANN